jgi:hypothetical protein
MIGKAMPICVIYPWGLGGTWIGIIRKLACHRFGSPKSIPASDMIQKGRTGGDQFETPAQQSLIRTDAKTAAFALIGHTSTRT